MTHLQTLLLVVEVTHLHVGVVPHRGGQRLGRSAAHGAELVGDGALVLNAGEADGVLVDAQQLREACGEGELFHVLLHQSEVQCSGEGDARALAWVRLGTVLAFATLR